MSHVRTVPFIAPAGSAIDPLVEEITWRAWELVAADPSQLSQEAAQRVTIGFDCLVEAAWRPGRSVIASEVEHLPDADPAIRARLAVGVLGERGATAIESVGVAAHVEAVLRRQTVLEVRKADPAQVVPFADPTHPEPALRRSLRSGHLAHIRQRSWTVSDSDEDVEIVSRFAPTVEPWTGVVDHLIELGTHVRVRATVLATELSPADRIEIESSLDTVGRIRQRNESSPQVRFDTDRAEATLLDLRASLSSPVVAGEIAVWSAESLSDSSLRSIATNFTSETDVLRRQGHVVVASNRLVLGGFEIERDPAGWTDAYDVCLPLRGGVGPRGIGDLLTLTESPIGWPLPFGRPIPTIPGRIVVERAAPPDLVSHDPEGAPVVGHEPSGRPVGLPLDLRTRHVVVTGTWGTGKSTVLRAQALADLRAGRPLLLIDPHGTAADELIAFAVELDRDPVIIDAADGVTARLRTLPSFHGSDPVSRDLLARRFAEAVASSLPNEEWAGPRWFAAFTALAEVVSVHGAELIDGMVWLNQPTELNRRIKDPRVSPAARSTLLNLTAGTGDGADVRGWVSSKLNPLIGGTVRRILAPAGQGVDLGNAIRAGRPVIVSLASLSAGEGNLVGHLALASVLDAAFSRPPDERELLTCYVDEAHRFPAAGLSRALAEGRKFGIGLMLALQSLGQASQGLHDLVLGAETQIVFRSTPESAARLGPIVDVPAAELVNLPDLRAIVGLRGRAPASIHVPVAEECDVPRLVVPPKAPEPDGDLATDGDSTSSFIDHFLKSIGDDAVDSSPAAN